MKNTITKNLKWPLLLFVSLASMNVTSQTSFDLPSGYQTFIDYDGNEQRAEGDFDGDGINDLVILCSSEDEGTIMVVYLTSRYFVDQSYFWFPWDSDMNTFTYENNVLTIDAIYGTGRWGTTLKLKYYANLKNMKLIGYDEWQLPDYDQNGGFNKSINLNTNEYQVNDGVKKKIGIDLITLSNIEDYFVYLSEIGQNEIDN
jgi:hypothetical protein